MVLDVKTQGKEGKTQSVHLHSGDQAIRKGLWNKCCLQG